MSAREVVVIGGGQADARRSRWDAAYLARAISSFAPG
jgi:hypothetical protein